MISSSPNIVIDVGVGYALCVRDSSTTALRAELALLVEQGGWLFAPTLWRYEITLMLTKAVHFKQLSESSARDVLELSTEMRVQLIHPDRELVLQAFDWTRRLKRAVAYDSFYLALAQRLKCELWTLDKGLANAVAAPWVRYVGNTK